MKKMWLESAEPYLQKFTDRHFVSKNVNVFGIGESELESKIRLLMENAANPSIAPYCGDGEVRLRVTASGKSIAECEILVAGAIEQIKNSEIGSYIYGIDTTLASALVGRLRESGKTVKAMKATLMSAALLVGFFYVGDGMLKLFHVDIQSFAVAGSLVIFLMAIEMLLDVEIFKFNGPTGEATIVPLVFPLIAGAGSFTTLLSLRAEYADVNILLGLLANMAFVFFVLTMTHKVQNWIGKGGVYVVRKFFGVILIAVAVRLFTDNITTLILDISSQVQAAP
jgi:multiple antibiotic resistance protein